MAASGDISIELDFDSHDKTQDTRIEASPTDISPPPPTKHALRLPSFEALGIASPHPNKLSLDHLSPCTCVVGHGAVDIGSSAIAKIAGLSAANIPHNLLPLVATHLASALTPPNESNDVLWARTVSPSDHATAPSNVQDIMSNDDHQQVVRQASTITPHLTPCTTLEEAMLGREGDQDSPWLGDALESLLSSSNPLTKPDHTFKVLSHALPYPSHDGHVFKKVMSTLYERPSMGDTSWINVFHALPGRSTLADLPKSPPTTPGQPLHNDDYFTQKIFDSAVTISDYHTDLSLLPRSPRPAVPPSSIDITVVERYIPPTTSLEFNSMFNLNAPSILVDRLIELSPDQGSLLFIYPTRTGAQTFAREYLSPVLDPLLRTISMIHSLPMAFCSAVGTLPVIDQLLEHEETKDRFQQLCKRLSRSSSASQPSNYTLVHASTALVSLQRQVWAKEWWIKQEKERLRGEVVKWTQDARTRVKTDAEVEAEAIARPAAERTSATAAEILQQLLDGIVNRPYPAEQTPVSGVEVNVFVVRRSR